MGDITTFFTLYEGLCDNGLGVADIATDEIQQEETWQKTDEELLELLNNILQGIKTLDDYRMLVTVLSKMVDQITLRFLYIFFKALILVEERIWASAGMHPPVAQIMDKHIDLLLYQYTEFAYNLEVDLVGWAKESGDFAIPEKKKFIQERNKIYQDYIVFAGKVIDVVY